VDKDLHTSDFALHQAKEEPKRRDLRRPYERPRLERFEASSSILGNSTPAAPDGGSGSFRPLKP